MTLQSSRIDEPRSPPQSQADSHQNIQALYSRTVKRAPLTKANLKLFESMDGSLKKKLKSDTISTSYDSEAMSAKSKQTTSTTAAAFQDSAFANGIQTPITSKPPTNLAQLKTQMNRHREGSPSLSDSECEMMLYSIKTAPNEQTLLLRTTQLLKQYGAKDKGYAKVYNQAFAAFPKNLGFNNNLLAAQPDMVEELEMHQFTPFPIREQVGGAAVLSSGECAITLPHIAGEWKGPGGSIKVATTQAAYNGACMVYGRNKALLYTGNPDPIGYAQVFTFAIDGSNIYAFAHYSSQYQGRVIYHQSPIGVLTLLFDADSLKQTRQLLRNLQDAAKEASEKLRDELLEKWSAIVSTTVDADNQMESDQKRKPAIDTIEEPSEVEQESNARKSRRKL